MLIYRIIDLVIDNDAKTIHIKVDVCNDPNIVRHPLLINQFDENMSRVVLDRSIKMLEKKHDVCLVRESSSVTLKYATLHIPAPLFYDLRGSVLDGSSDAKIPEAFLRMMHSSARKLSILKADPIIEPTFRNLHAVLAAELGPMPDPNRFFSSRRMPVKQCIASTLDSIATTILSHQ